MNIIFAPVASAFFFSLVMPFWNALVRVGSDGR